MSHLISHHNDDVDDGPMLKPRPSRPTELSSAHSSTPPTPRSESRDVPHARSSPNGPAVEGLATPSRNRSLMNLTSSTLLGIYQGTGYAADSDGPATPWGTGAETPIDSSGGTFDFTKSTIPDMVTQKGPNGLRKRRKSTNARARPRKDFKAHYLPIVGKDLVLFGLGMLYGLLISRLHERSGLVPVKVEAVNRSGWAYLIFWGSVAVAVGEALPWFDTFWAPLEDQEDEVEDTHNISRKKSNNVAKSLNDVVRPIGAFVGIAFAVRKLPWQSTLQLSLTLALANPAIWYLIDRSPSGFIFSTLVALTGTVILLVVNPAMVPSPSPVPVPQQHGNITGQAAGLNDLVLGMLGPESIGVGVWIMSVLFVSAVCFGNIGRRLSPRA